MFFESVGGWVIGSYIRVFKIFLEVFELIMQQLPLQHQLRNVKKMVCNANKIAIFRYLLTAEKIVKIGKYLIT